MAKIKLENLKQQLAELTAEIDWKEKQIPGLLDYGKTVEMKKEITILKERRHELIKQMTEFRRRKEFIKNRGKLRTIGFRNGNRTVML